MISKQTWKSRYPKDTFDPVNQSINLKRI